MDHLRVCEFNCSPAPVFEFEFEFEFLSVLLLISLVMFMIGPPSADFQPGAAFPGLHH